eukprot:CAMPEP_0206496432 /NCGR_PEP_ID=MMETSP0324_2-20121206/49399_1 /ASSEMBLY_ACC=CAM_ASM_000836 /TAXON_ID=2866 /ORGANISM="Crypthecodinium cohnii, Strain Seligo" /LENGTH=161 /DNA_ID=CAMNT_0053981435 /DNA_START=421 /DNA_END=906 /DNA_ORIENTATION=-
MSRPKTTTASTAVPVSTVSSSSVSVATAAAVVVVMVVVLILVVLVVALRVVTVEVLVVVTVVEGGKSILQSDEEVLGHTKSQLPSVKIVNDSSQTLAPQKQMSRSHASSISGTDEEDFAAIPPADSSCTYTDPDVQSSKDKGGRVSDATVRAKMSSASATS